MHLDTTGPSERVIDAIRATVADTDGDIAEMETDEAMTRRALDLLGSRRNDAYEAALAALREDTQVLVGEHARAAIQTNSEMAKSRPLPTSRACAASSKARCCRGSKTAGRNWSTGR